MAQQAVKSRAEDFEDAPALLGTLDCLRSAITIFDSDGRLAYANAHLNYLFRSLPPRQTLIGKNYQELIRLEIEGGEIAREALAGGVQNFIARRLSQLQPEAFISRDVPLSGRRVVEIQARRTQDGRTLLLWTDVTAVRAQLAQLQEAMALSAEAFAFFDANDCLIQANEPYAQLCGVKNVEALLGMTFTEIAAHVAYGGRILLDTSPDHWLEWRLNGHRDPMGAVTIRTNTGEAYLVRDRATPDGGRIMVFTNITDKFRTETALAEQQKSYLADLASRLDAASASVASAKTTLLRTMGHELKTPLNAILGFSDLMMSLAETLKPAQVREYAGLVHQGGSNLLKIINQIMDLTKISAGRYDLRRAAVDAGGVMWLARDAFLARATARGIMIDADRCPTGLILDADEAVFTGMVCSLLDNAVAFTTGSRITLSAAPAETGIAVVVEDDGQGVAPEDLARIQEPFEHAGGGEAAQHGKGAGLGLTLVKAFAELHGGRLELESRSGEGFRATIILPPVRVPATA